MRPEYIVALVTLAGVLATSTLTRLASRDTARLSILDVTVQRLSERVAALERALDVAEESEREARARERAAWTRVGAQDRLILALRMWGRQMASRLEVLGEYTPREPVPGDDDVVE